ncbi:MAG TPA: UDP-N-acetylmuramoyl-tripeptide--D-alanyl-D-alanine ligase, partial [Bryobacteraceae bacterium]
MTLDLVEVARAMRASGGTEAVKVSGWSVDTRTLCVGNVYFALHGERLNGHAFVGEAVGKGAA